MPSDCGQCQQHSGILARLKSGDECMHRLEKALKGLRNDFTTYTEKQTVRTISILVMLLMCLVTGMVGIYTFNIKAKITQPTITIDLKQLIEEIKDD